MKIKKTKAKKFCFGLINYFDLSSIDFL